MHYKLFQIATNLIPSGMSQPDRGRMCQTRSPLLTRDMIINQEIKPALACPSGFHRLGRPENMTPTEECMPKPIPGSVLSLI